MATLKNSIKNLICVFIKLKTPVVSVRCRNIITWCEKEAISEKIYFCLGKTIFNQNYPDNLLGFHDNWIVCTSCLVGYPGVKTTKIWLAKFKNTSKINKCNHAFRFLENTYFIKFLIWKTKTLLIHFKIHSCFSFKLTIKIKYYCIIHGATILIITKQTQSTYESLN